MSAVLAAPRGAALPDAERTALDAIEERACEMVCGVEDPPVAAPVDAEREADRLGLPARRQWEVPRELVDVADRGTPPAVDRLAGVAHRRDRVTTPDLICVIDSVAGEAIGTETLRYGQRVSVIALPAPPILLTAKGLEHVGPRAFGYDLDFRAVFAEAGEG